MSRPRPVCDKVKLSRGEAHKTAKFWGQRPYECEICFGWHLSKQDRSERVHVGAREHLRKNYCWREE